MEVLIALVVLALVAAFVLAPLREGPEARGREGLRAVPLEDLEARKQAKLREIRDTELDHAQGKLEEAEFEAQSAELRAEAIEILRAIDERKRAGG